jgi:alkanesulfonate monooxygenase SsuD/methylene tetrahydromethanopterin reductase-like flavin-dependent oxidoreductase (luciferase family)
MKFGLMSQLQVPKPWAQDTERTVYWQNLDHVAAAEDSGFSYFWLTEQHFFAEIGHSACPEMFLAALSQHPLYACRGQAPCRGVSRGDQGRRPAHFAGRFANNHVGVFAIGCVHDDDRIGREVGCAAARFYYGDNDAELNHVRFGSSEGVARIRARMAGYSNDELLDSGMAIGGNADSVCRQVERWAATGIDQMIFMFQIGHTTHDQITGRGRSRAL